MNRYTGYTLLLILILGFSTRVFSQDNPEEYRKTIEMADNYFSGGDYINAKASYQIAVKMAPQDAYPKERLQLSLEMIKSQMQLNTLFAEKIVQADELYSQNDLEAALKVYQSALGILPGDTYAAGRAQEISETLNEKKLREENYLKKLNSGDKLVQEGNLEAALKEFRDASAAKPEEQYPKEQIARLEKLIDGEKALDDAFETALQAADIALQRNKFDEAISQIEDAIRLRPNDEASLKKLEEARSLKADYESYASILEQGDNFYMDKYFEEAKAKYEQALKIKPEDEYPKSMLEKVEIALMDITKANRSSYEIAIARADKFFNEQDYDQAMVEYKNARRFYPEESYAQQRIESINEALNFRKTQEEAYNQSISKADNLFQEQRYEEAKEEYQRAVGFKSMEQYPKVKIDEINTILAELENQREIYTSLVKGADKLFFSDNYVESREQYRKALDLFPKEKYPQDQITMINEILGMRDIYTKSLTRGDKLLSEKKYDEALKEYREASKIDSKDVYLQGRIYEIELLVAEQTRQAAQRREYDSVLAIADGQFRDGDYELAMQTYQSASVIIPSLTYPIQKIGEIEEIMADRKAQEAIDIQFGDAISKADKLFSDNDMEGALLAYQDALKLKPGEEYASGKITEIEGMLGEIALKEAIERQFEDAISKADQLFAAKDYQQALISYQSALNLKPDEEYPKGRVAMINGIIGDLAAKEALDEQYGDAISYADGLFEMKEYRSALAAYQEALSLKPGEALPKAKIDEINAILQEIAGQEALDRQFEDAISNADKLFAAKDYPTALTAYQDALSIKPGEALPKAKIDEINAILQEIADQEALERQFGDAISNADKLFAAKEYQTALTAYQEALNLKPGEALPKAKIDEIDAILKGIADQLALDRQFEDAISNADKLFTAKEYPTALTSYQEALNLKPGEALPQTRIDEINAILKEIANQEALERQFEDAISNADKLFDQKDFQQAQLAYQQALTIKADDNYSKMRLAEIDNALAELAKEAETQKKYDDALAFAEKHLAANDYENARYEFQVAGSIKPGEAYPVEKIAEIDRKLDEIARQKELDNQYNKLIAQADEFFRNDQLEESRATYQEALKVKPAEDYPNKQLVAISQRMEILAVEKDKSYQVSISKADNYFEQSDYQMAKIHYERALELKPEEVYPLDKLKVVNEEIMKKRQLIQQEYDKSVADADKFYASKIYDNAIDAYRAASVLKPDEEYPKEMVRRILKLLSDRAIVQLNKESRLISNNTQAKFDFLPVSVKDRKSNYIFFRARNASENEYKLIINFGKDQSKNGGVVVKVPAGEELNEFIIRISAQYKWFSDDNNWITFYPEGGDLEVFLLQISYSD